MEKKYTPDKEKEMPRTSVNAPVNSPVKNERLESEEVKAETKVEKKEEKKTEKKEKVKKEEAIINGKDLPISTKHSMAICDFIRGRRIEEVIPELEKVVKLKKAVPMKGEIPHRKGKGMMSGRYPVNASKVFIRLLKSLNANASANGIENAYIISAVPNKASRPHKRGGRERFKRTNLVLIAREKRSQNQVKAQEIKMEERKFVALKKDELNIKEFVKENLGKGKTGEVNIEYTPVGEKIIIATNKPGYVIGRKGEKIIEITKVLKRRFKLENPNIEIREINKPEFDSQTVADDIALSLEKVGSLKFKIIAYRMLDRIMKAGALGAEIRLSGKLPSERAKSWRFAAGYLKKTGDTAKIVNKAKAVAKTMMGVIGVKVSILSPDAKIHDRIILTDEIKTRIKTPFIEPETEEKKPKKTKKAKETK